jgi:rhodanese-related sulfurtransferase
MSKHRKHHQSAEGASEPVTPPGGGVRSSDGIFSRSLMLQLLAIVGLSCVLGFTFNAASPVGVRFGKPAATKVAAKVTADLTPPTITPVQTIPVAPTFLVPTSVTVTPPAPQFAPPPPAPVVVSPPAPSSAANTITNPAAAAAAPQPGQPNPAPIHWSEAKVLAAEGRAVLVDVRHKAMFDAGHIPGATSLPETSSPEEFKAYLSQQPTNLTVIVYCSSTSCSQSARVANRLVNEFRWLSVRYMTGGYQEYQQSELANPTPPLAP